MPEEFVPTVVINLYAGPGSGKSTLQAELFAKLKRLKQPTEIVREYVKEWAWAGRPIEPFDQFFIAAKQAQLEALFYGKVKFLISDSPLMLGCFYEKEINGDSIAMPSALRLINRAERMGVSYKNFFLVRQKEYDPQGRYHSEEEAVDLDKKIATFLEENGIAFEILKMHDSLRADHIIAKVTAQ